MRRALAPLVLSVALAACTGGGGVDASVDARALTCDAPLSMALAPSTRPPNVGLPVASIAWTGDRCALYPDEGHPDTVLFIADSDGTWFDVGLIAQANSRWFIAESSTGAMRTTYLAGVPRATVVNVVLQSDSTDNQVSIDFRVDDDTLTLLAMSELN